MFIEAIEENASVGDFCKTCKPPLGLVEPIIFQVVKSYMRQMELLNVRQKFKQEVNLVTEIRLKVKTGT